MNEFIPSCRIEPSPGWWEDSREHYNRHLTEQKGRGKMKVLQLSTKYRFMLDGVRTAVLEKNGKLFTFTDSNGEASGMTEYKSYADWVKEVMQDVPASGSEDAVLEQLGMLLGDYEVVDDQVNSTQTAKQKKKEKDDKEEAGTPAKDENTMATKKAAPKKAAAKKSETRELKDCICGHPTCKAKTYGNFAPGHDARVHGWGKKIARGEMKFNEISASAAKYLKEHGIVANSEKK